VTDAYDAVVYDLDGTLVNLDVNWDDVRRDVAAVVRARGIDVDGDSLWTLLERAQADGYRHAVEEKIVEHERAGARSATLVGLIDDIASDDPVGVCSLNCEAACRIALELHGLDKHVDAIVGRDSVETYKPDPEPLLHTLALLSVAPERALFIGDSKRDAVTAERAGVDFQYVLEYSP